MSATSFSRHPGRVLLAFLGLGAFACSAPGGGCTALEPIPGGRYVGPKTDDAVNMRISANGLDYLNQNWKPLVDAFAPNQTIAFPLACSVQKNIQFIGDVA